MDWWNELVGMDYGGDEMFLGGEDTPFVGDQSLLEDLVPTDAELSGVSLAPLESYNMGGNIPNQSNYVYGAPDTHGSYQGMEGLPQLTPLEQFGTQGGGNMNGGTAVSPMGQVSLSPSVTNAPTLGGTSPSILQDLLNKGKEGYSSLDKALGGNTGKLALGLGGALASYLGNRQQQKATQAGQKNYLDYVSWTPERVNNYMDALRSNVTSLYGNQAQGQNRAMSKSNAIKGRGGGSYGKANEAIGREMRSNIAQALNQGALTTNQPNRQVSPSAFTQTSPEGNALQGLGAMAGNNLSQSQANDALLKMLGLLK
jgi:hypothetical protein